MTDLGRFTIGDVSAWDVLDLFSNPETVRYLGVPLVSTMDEAAAVVERYASSPTRWLSVRDGAEFLGIVGVETKGHQATVVIAFKPTRKARGAGRSFSVPLVQWIFTNPHIWRVWAYCHVENFPVQRVLERMGAMCEGRLRRFEVFPNISPEPQDCYVYAIVRDR